MAALLALVATLGCFSTAAASCALPPGAGDATTLTAQLDAAPAVFVGTVVGTANQGRVARVRVEFVWKGSPVPTMVTVSGTPDAASAATSVDRTFAVGQRYLFVPASATSPFQDSNCSGTQVYSSRLDPLRPATAHSPSGGSDGLDPSGLAFAPLWVWPSLAIALLTLGIVAGVLIRRRRRQIRQRAAPLRVTSPGGLG